LQIKGGKCNKVVIDNVADIKTSMQNG